MTFEKALFEFRQKLMGMYGPEAEITKIGLSYPLYDSVMREIYGMRSHAFAFTSPSDVANLRMFDIEIVPRKAELKPQANDGGELTLPDYR